MMFKIIHNIETGEITQVDLVGDELAEFIAKEAEAKEAEKKFSKELADAKKAKEKQELEKAALLVRLGLTKDELQTILG